MGVVVAPTRGVELASGRLLAHRQVVELVAALPEDADGRPGGLRLRHP